MSNMGLSMNSCNAIINWILEMHDVRRSVQISQMWSREKKFAKCYFNIPIARANFSGQWERTYFPHNFKYILKTMLPLLDQGCITYSIWESNHYRYSSCVSEMWTHSWSFNYQYYEYFQMNVLEMYYHCHWRANIKVDIWVGWEFWIR